MGEPGGAVEVRGDLARHLGDDPVQIVRSRSKDPKLELVGSEPGPKEVADAAGQVTIDDNKIDTVDLVAATVWEGRRPLLVPKPTYLGPWVIHSRRSCLKHPTSNDG
jgi:hypothetical protein